MGQSSSKHDTSSYDPTAFKQDLLTDRDPREHGHGWTRRARSTSDSRSSRNAPETTGATHGHRRARSALAGNAQGTTRESLPPPYSSTIDIPVPIINMPMPEPLKSPVSPTSDFKDFPVSSGAGLNRNPFQEPAFSMIISGRPQNLSKAQRLEYLRRPMRKESVEDALETLRKYNTVIVVDDSGSMYGQRWKEAQEALAALANIASQYDTDGIDVCFLNSRIVGENMKSADDVRNIFNGVTPQGITPIGEKLEKLLLKYMKELETAKAKDGADGAAVKPVNYIVLTDGAPTDDPEEVIVTVARRLDAGNFPLTQVGIQFVQIGNSSDATAFLDELDNNLGDRFNVRDMVDTTPYLGSELNAEIIIKILLGGINRRVDRKGGRSVL